ncbi:sigma-70 family RNA polymerase sigma factor [Thermodesulfobacteriota bacterium]
MLQNGMLGDADLVRSFQGGRKEAFDTLVMRHKDKVFNLCYRFLGDYQEASDMAQEIFIKVYRSLKKFRFESAFSTWVYRIAVNTCKNRLKSLEFRFKKRIMRIGNPEPSEAHNPSVELADESSPMTELEQKERSLMIQRAIDSLPAKKKTVVVLRDIEGLSYEEIANITGFNLGTVKSTLARARFDLKERLRGMIQNEM